MDMMDSIWELTEIIHIIFSVNHNSLLLLEIHHVATIIRPTTPTLTFLR